MDEGFSSRFETLLAYDINACCVNTFAHNHASAAARIADLSMIGIDEIVADWKAVSSSPPIGIVGGPPCQSFSTGNVHKKDSDIRDSLPGHYARILNGLDRHFNSIHFFVFENVPGLLGGEHNGAYDEFKSLVNERFAIAEAFLDAADYDVPQMRKRIFVVGLNKALYSKKFSFPDGRIDDDSYKCVEDVIGGLPEPVYFQRGLARDDIPFHPNHWCMRPKSKKFTSGELKAGQRRGRSFRVLAWDQPSPTVAYGHREVHVHPRCHRRLSLYEAMRLQGFPGWYELLGTMSQQIDMVSDAVSPPVAEAIASEVANQIDFNIDSMSLTTAA